MIVYADTSALAKLFLEEDGSEEMRAISRDVEVTSSVAVAYVELRARLRRRFAAAGCSLLRDSLTIELERVWSGLGVIAVDEVLLRRAGDLAEQMRLRAYDALHLTALQESGDPGELTFACWDSELRAAAESLGYQILPR